MKKLLIVTALALIAPSSFATESNTFKWADDFRAGDCHSDTVSVVIRSDGSGRLTSISWTNKTHSGDYWWWSIEGMDANKVVIWTVPYHRGPRMDDGHPAPRYHNDFDFKFDAAKYPGTAFLSVGGKC